MRLPLAASRLRNAFEEVAELGPSGTVFRVGWELRTRTPWAPRTKKTLGAVKDPGLFDRIPFANPIAVTGCIRPLQDPAALTRLQAVAKDAQRGRIVAFGGQTLDYGCPIDWHRDPLTGGTHDRSSNWSRALRGADRVGDVKIAWEIARFPQAFHFARAAAFAPDRRGDLAPALFEQMRQFVQENPYPLGIHWSSGQEIAFRCFAWSFAAAALLRDSSVGEAAADLIPTALALAAAHVEACLDYAERAVTNNHVLSESLLLIWVAALMPALPSAARWNERGMATLLEHAHRQFYADGGYIQQSHTYHRLAIQVLMLACIVRGIEDPATAPLWACLERSLDFLLVAQNPGDGRLPNYGNNDGGMPLVLSSCDYTDFRPTLQAASLLTRRERIYEAGPWDEEAAWLLGPKALAAPLRPTARRSASFGWSGYQVLASPTEPRTFAAFRCGTLRDRFAQIDMLHVDHFFEGENVLADPGSYSYNGPAEWHEHFFRTASHNTLTVDGLDQMLHYRRFKFLYPAKATLIRFEVGEGSVTAVGEHEGYLRPTGCIHRRSVTLSKAGLLVVVDHVMGTGEHHVRLHWLLGVDTVPEGFFVKSAAAPQGWHLGVFDGEGRPLCLDRSRGVEAPPRGWISRRYAEKVPADSLVVEGSLTLPATFVTVAGPGEPAWERSGQGFVARAGAVQRRFHLSEGIAEAVDD